MQNGGEAGIRTPDAALTAYSLSRERLQPLGHLTTRLFRVLRRTCFCSSSLRWRTYYFLVLISQTLFETFFVCTLRTQFACKNGKRAIYQQEISPDAGITPNDQSGKGNEKRYGAGEKQKKGKAAVSDAPHCTARRGNLVTGLLGFFSLNTLVDLFTVNRHFFRGVYANTNWLPFTPKTVTVTSSPIMRVSPTRRVRISILCSLKD